MADTTISPNMNLVVPTVSEDPGPDWANNINASLNIIDSHSHSSGQGVPVTPDGINISSDLSFGTNNATALRSARFSSQNVPLALATDIGCLYESGVDLYFNDGNGNQIRITQAGSVSGSSGTITGLPSGTASASFAAGTFTFQSATNTPASMNTGPLITGAAIAGAKTVTFQASASLAANYAMTLPLALPASSAYLSSDSSGNLSFTGTGISIPQPSIQGVTDGSSASAGAVGEVLAATNSGTVCTFGSGDVTVVTLTLTPGCWLVSGSLNMTTTAGGNEGFQSKINALGAGVGSTVGFDFISQVGPAASNNTNSVTFHPRIINLTSATSVKTVVFTGRSVSATVTIAGSAYAVRFR